LYGKSFETGCGFALRKMGHNPGPSLCGDITYLVLVEQLGGLGFSTYSFILAIKISTQNHVVPCKTTKGDGKPTSHTRFALTSRKTTRVLGIAVGIGTPCLVSVSVGIINKIRETTRMTTRG